MNELWLRQVQGVLRLELKKNLFSMRSAPIYLLAMMPLGAFVLFVLVNMINGTPSDLAGATGASTFFAIAYPFTLGFLYFGCVWIFMNLFRGEVLDRSLHYYFLAPIRREVLVAGKYLSGLAVSAIVFATSTVACFLLSYGYLIGKDFADFMLRGPGLGHLIGYTSVTVLGCLGYGAVFLLVGLFFRNPLVPAIVIFMWEGITFLLPPLLKKISVIFYLQSLLPVPTDDGPFAVLAEPVSAWIAVPGLLIFTGVTLFVAGLRIRRMEIAYAD